MDVGIVGAGIAGLSAAWWLRRAGHRVLVFERNYKPGGRMNSRRKAGLIVDHGQRFLFRHATVLRELILDCGLHGELSSVDQAVYHLDENGDFLESPEDAIDSSRVVFPGGMLTLPEALRRTLGGFYSIGVTSIEWNEDEKKFRLLTEPPMRANETRVDAVMVACAAPEGLRITKPLHEKFNSSFLERLAKVQYTRNIVLVAALEKVLLPKPFYGLVPFHDKNAVINWLAFEDQKCMGRAVEGWSSLIAQTTPEAAERLWKMKEEKALEEIYAEARGLIPQLPEKWRWVRSKYWEIARLKDKEDLLTTTNYPATPDDVLVEFCGDYRVGDGAEQAAQSGRDSADSLLKKIEKLS